MLEYKETEKVFMTVLPHNPEAPNRWEAFGLDAQAFQEITRVIRLCKENYPDVDTQTICKQAEFLEKYLPKRYFVYYFMKFALPNKTWKGDDYA